MAVHHLNIGELIVSPQPTVISTILGSCVSVCLFSKKHRTGGAIHYALARAPANVVHSDSFRYGDLAIHNLIQELQLATGDDPRQFFAKIVGGCATAGGHTPEFQAGPPNIEMAREILARYRIPIIGEDVGGAIGRKLHFHTATGRLQVSLLGAGASRPAMQPRRILIVDESAAVREMLSRQLQEDPELRVVGMAASTFEATRLLTREKPDVITLDIDMAGRSGIQWLEKVMSASPLPVVMISALRNQDGMEVFKATERGVVDYIEKPDLSLLPSLGPLIREKVKAASFANLKKAPAQSRRRNFEGELDFRGILAIGASTGGTEALKRVMSALPARIPPTLIVQHIPPAFSKPFANRLNDICPFEVKEAEDGDELRISRVLVAPGGKQMRIERIRQGFCVRLTDDAPMNRHKPSVDYLFKSVASLFGSKAVGVILTGMGADGAEGLLQMRKNGSLTLGQDEDSSVVYGMPRVAFDRGAVGKVVPLSEMSDAILSCFAKKNAV